jgi:hypothetical protein
LKKEGDKMPRNKKPSELFKKVDGKKIILFDTRGDFLEEGKINFEIKNGDGRLYLNNKEISLSSVRGIIYNLKDYEGLIFVDSKYKLSVKNN